MVPDQDLTLHRPPTELISPTETVSSERRRPRRKLRGESALLAFPLVALALLFLVRPFLLEPFYIPSPSMIPTLAIGDRVMVNKVSYRLGEPERGEVAVFYGSEESGYPEEIYVKRIIGLPGEWVLIEEGKTFVQGMPLDESYIHKDPYSSFGPYRVPEGSYFMMGDNRRDSRDSRYWGAIPRENLIGKTVGVFWPLQRMQQVR